LIYAHLDIAHTCISCFVCGIVFSSADVMSCLLVVQSGRHSAQLISVVVRASDL